MPKILGVEQLQSGQNNEEFARYHIGDTVLFNYKGRFVSKTQRKTITTYVKTGEEYWCNYND